MIDNGQLMTAVSDLVQVLVLVVILAAVQLARRWVSAKQIETAHQVALAAANAVEQLAVRGVIDRQAKKEEAIAAAQILGAKVGLNLTADQWGILVESVVKGWKSYGELRSQTPKVDTPAETPVWPDA